MAKISKADAVKNLVKLYTNTEGMDKQQADGFLQHTFEQTKQEYDRRNPHVQMDWATATQGRNARGRAMFALELFYAGSSYEYILDCYKTAKQAAKDADVA